ncbi:MAG: tryptophan synthase subunit alpha [Rikenellaceae bacterium]
MNRIDKLFAEKSSDVLSVYYPGGFPNLDDTMAILGELQSQGVDMVELGVPFSDPMADGVVIQQASTKSLENGMSLKLLFSQIESMRETITIPVILMGYLNPIMHYGFEKFCADCKRVGVDGMIIPDLPYKEYMAEYKAIADQYGVNVVMFISPETSDERVRLIDANTNGFIYMVSSAGTTGARSSFAGSGDGYFERINSMSLKNPRMIGFGVSSPETFRTACNASNGAIIGSHFVKLLESEPSIKAAVTKLRSDMGL